MKWSHLGLSKLWFTMSLHVAGTRQDFYLTYSWDELFLAAEAGEL